MQKIKKLLAVVLTALILISSIPLTSFASTDNTLQVNEDSIFVEDLQIFDLQPATFNESTGFYDIPTFNYRVYLSDNTVITKSSTDADENFAVRHEQQYSSWQAGGQYNPLYVSYMGYEIVTSVTVIEDFFHFYHTDAGVVIFNISDLLTGAVAIPDTINGQPVVALDGIGKNVTELTIPASVTDIRTHWLTDKNCAPMLKTINVSSKNPNYSSYDGILYNKSKTEVLAVPAARTKNITLHKAVKTIEYLTLPDGVTVKTDPESKYFCSKGGVIYNKAVTKVVFVNKNISGSYTMPSTVTTINYGAFSECNDLTSVKMSNSVTTITYDVFYSCDSLKSVTLPNKLKSIGGGAFSECKSLKSITLPSTLKTIGGDAFSLTGLKTISFPDSVESIGHFAFASLPNLESVRFGKGIKYIGTAAFDGSEKIQRVYISNLKGWCNVDFRTEHSNPLYFAKKLYINDKLTTKLVIPSSVEKISDYAFCNFQGLKSISLNDKLKTIGDYSFANTLIKKLVIPNKVTKIGSCAFSNCKQLADITLGKALKTIDSCAFEGTAITEINIPNSVTALNGAVFSNCKNLKTVTIGTGLKDFYAGNFYDCNKIKDIKINSKNKYIYSDDNAVYSKTRSAIIMYYKQGNLGYVVADGTTQIDIPAFSATNASSSLKTLILPNSVTSLTYYSFFSCQNLTSLTSIKLPNKTEAIADMTFNNSKKIVSVTIPKSVTYIGYQAFGSKIKHVYYAGTKAQWKKIAIAEGNENLLGATIHYNSKGCTHKYSKGADLSCNVCGYFEILPTTRKISGKTYYYVNGKKATSFTGITKADGKTIFVKKGVVTPNLDSPKVKLENTKLGVEVSWSKVTAAKTYKVYRSVYSGGKWSKYKEYKHTKSLNFTDKVKSGTRVRYTVYACNGKITSKFKTGVITTYLAATTPKAKKISTGINISWSKVKGANKYLVYRREYKNGKWTELKAVKKTSSLKFTDKSAKKNIKYQYAVVACLGDTRSTKEYSNSAKR